ncbi:MAG TPA: tyrosinase family protein [Longimicrobium sp.]|jgi:tyrosinase
MEDLPLRRRQFLKSVSAAAGAFALGGGAPGALAALSPKRAGAAGVVPFVRRNINTFSAAQLASLRNGIAVMKGRPPNNPTSWLYQANIHGTYDTPVLPVWNTCQHGHYMFLSWHRMYLYFFERILRAASGDPTLALPYWNYLPATARALPAPFRTPVAGNPLYVAQRNTGINAGTTTLPDWAVSNAAAYAFTNFTATTSPWGQSFGGGVVTGAQHFTNRTGSLESIPHNQIHNLVGGPGWMGDPNMAARDPIFWLHHANIDRLWAGWIALGGGRSNPSGASPADMQWKNLQFSFFDENGTAVQMSGQQVVNTAQQLNYVYDTGVTIDPKLQDLLRRLRLFYVVVRWPRIPDPDPGPLRQQVPVELGRGVTRTRVGIPRAALRGLTAAAAGESAERVFLTLEGVSFRQNPGVVFHVFVNAPAAVLERQQQSPDTSSPFYAGTLDFFSLLGQLQHAGTDRASATLVVDATEAVQQLAKQRQLGSAPVEVSFVATGLVSAQGGRSLAAPAAPVRIARAGFVTAAAERAEQ